MTQTQTDAKLDAIASKVDTLAEKLHTIDVTLVGMAVNVSRNTDDLSEHIRRTALLEESIKPIQQHVVMVNTTLKVIGVIASAVVTLLGIFKMFGVL